MNEIDPYYSIYLDINIIKKIPMGEIQESEIVYSRDIPDIDKNDFYRVTKKYWWTSPDDK